MSLLEEVINNSSTASLYQFIDQTLHWEEAREGLGLNKSKAKMGSWFLSKISIETQTQTKERLPSRVSVSV